MHRTLGPAKDDAPLIVHPDAVGPAPTSPECLEPVAWRRAKVQQLVCSVQHVELADGSRHDVGWKGPCSPGARTVVQIGRGPRGY
jgi:hypothetical protein